MDVDDKMQCRRTDASLKHGNTIERMKDRIAKVCPKIRESDFGKKNTILVYDVWILSRSVWTEECDYEDASQ